LLSISRISNWLGESGHGGRLYIWNGCIGLEGIVSFLPIDKNWCGMRFWANSTSKEPQALKPRLLCVLAALLKQCPYQGHSCKPFARFDSVRSQTLTLMLTNL